MGMSRRERRHPDDCSGHHGRVAIKKLIDKTDAPITGAGLES
jgi:hypothetical protein